MIATQSYAAFEANSALRPYSFHRRAPGPKDVAIDIKYCGICHTDLHFVKNDLGMSHQRRACRRTEGWPTESSIFDSYAQG